MSQMIDRIAAAIHNEMDVTDGLDLPAAQRYARAATKVLRDHLYSAGNSCSDLVADGLDEELRGTS